MKSQQFSSTRAKILWFDVGDLLWWEHDHVTGIQRTMLSVLLVLWRAPGYADSVRYCRFRGDSEDNDFFEVDKPDIDACVRRLSGSGPEQHSHVTENLQSVNLQMQASLDETDKIAPLRQRLAALLPRDIKDETREFYIASSRLVRAGVKLVAALACLPASLIRSRAKVKLESLDQPCDFAAGDVLLNLGASWIYPQYMDAVAAARAYPGVRYVAVFHDLIPWRQPWFTPGAWELFLPWARQMVRTPDILLANSQNTKADICAFKRVEQAPAKEIHVIRWGDIPVVETDQNTSVSERVLRFRELPYVLSVGTIEIRKNHKLLFRVWQQLLERHGEKMPLLMWVGKKGWLTEDLMEDVENSRYLDGKLTILGNTLQGGISEADLKFLYQNCLFTLYPSHYEGWGLPVAESLSFGKYCVASNSSSIPEVGGNLIDYHDAGDVQACARLVERAIFDGAYRRAKEKEIRDKFKCQTWNECTSRILEIVGLPSGKSELKHDKHSHKK